MPLPPFTDDTTMEVFVDSVTPQGSAFGATSGGDAVYINERIMSALKLKAGDHLRAVVWPNYIEKRDKVRWRLVRAEVLGSLSAPQDPQPKAEPNLEQVIKDLLDEHGPLRTSTLTRLVNDKYPDHKRVNDGVAAVCWKMHVGGKVAVADVSATPGQKRISHRVWATDVNDFDVDPFE